MANNRLYLRDKRTGAMIHLGKRMGGEWYGASTVEFFTAFFEYTEGSDDFELVIEDAENAPSCRPENSLTPEDFEKADYWRDEAKKKLDEEMRRLSEAVCSRLDEETE